jgi:hypothetical protein
MHGIPFMFTIFIWIKKLNVSTGKDQIHSHAYSYSLTVRLIFELSQSISHHTGRWTYAKHSSYRNWSELCKWSSTRCVYCSVFLMKAREQTGILRVIRHSSSYQIGLKLIILWKPISESVGPWLSSSQDFATPTGQQFLVPLFLS